MAKSNRKCILCGTEYTYCSGCQKDKSKPLWMGEFHEENCKIIFKTCVSFYMQHITKDQAKEILSKCDLSKQSTFTPTVQNQLAVIFAEDPKPVVEKIEKEPVPTVAPKTVKAPAIKTEKAVKAPAAPKAAKTPVVDKTETIIAPEKAETIHEVVTETEEK